MKTVVLPAGAVARWRAAVAAQEGPSRTLLQLPLDPADVLGAVAGSPVAADLEAALGPAPWCNLSQSWLRRGRPPHAWHQDGALRHDFLADAGRTPPRGALLALRTLWIALTPCGVDAPSLAWVTQPTPDLLPVAELEDAAVQRRHGSAALAHAVLAPGEALLFDGALLHRTHLLPTMRSERLSLELRFFRADALPARVAGDAGRRLLAA